ncbi:MAG: efflux RND transporter permease subunit [Bacteroidia bacterium]
MWNSLASFTIRNRFWLLVAIGVFTLFFGFFALKVQLTYDFAKVIPQNDSDFVDYLKFKQVFGEDGNIMVIGVKSPDIFEKKFFGKWYDLCNEIENLDGVENVVSLTKLYNLYVDEAKAKLVLKPMLQKKLTTQSELDSFKTEVDKLKFYEGLIYNPKNNVTLIAVTLKKDKLDSKARIPLVKEIEKLSKNFGDELGTEIHISGLPYVRTIFSSRVADEIKIFTYISIAITALFILAFFKFFSAVLFSLVVVLIGVIATLGSIALFGYKITLLTGILPPLMVIIGVQNCIYLLNVYHQEFTKHGNKMLSLIRLISKNGLPLLLTNVTTAVGFLVFSFSGSALLDQFAIVAGTVIILMYGVSLIFIPIVYSYLPPPKPAHIKHLEGVRLNKVLDVCNYLIYNKRRYIYSFTFLLIAAAIIGSTKIDNVGYVVDDIPENDKVYTDLKFFETNLKGTLPFEIKVDTKEKDGIKDYTTLQKINQLSKRLDRFDELSKPVSVIDFIKFANQAVNNGDERFYIIPNVLDISKIISYLPQEQGNTRLLKSMVDSNFSMARISLQMADVGSARMKTLTAQVKNTIDSVFNPRKYNVKITGTSAIFLKGNDYLIKNLLQSMSLALVIISVMMAFLFFSWRMVLISLIPNIIPLILTLGIMGFFNIRLKPSTIIIFSIAYGIVVDFTIHYLAKYRHSLQRNNWNMAIAIPQSLSEAGPSIIYTAVALFAGFIIFSFSNFGGTVALGILTSLALFFGMLMNLLLLPSMLLSLDKRLNPQKEFENVLIDVEPEDE